MAAEEDVTPGLSQPPLETEEGAPGRAAIWLREHPGVVENLKVLLYVALIVLCVLFAPEAPLKFIYTEF